VTDHEALLDRHRTLRQLTHELQVLFAELIVSPLGGRQRRRIEPSPIGDPGSDLVVIAPHEGLRHGEVPESRHYIVRRGAVPDQISQNQGRIEAPLSGVVQHRGKSVPVTVHVSEDQVAHDGLPIKVSISLARSSGSRCSRIWMTQSARAYCDCRSSKSARAAS